MAGYRDTLNLPKTDFPMKAGLTQREPERLKWWEERGLYAKLRELRKGAPVWLLHDGPPYSNGHLHMGTAANKVWKDAAVRQASLMGHDSPYVPRLGQPRHADRGPGRQGVPQEEGTARSQHAS